MHLVLREQRLSAGKGIPEPGSNNLGIEVQPLCLGLLFQALADVDADAVTDFVLLIFEPVAVLREKANRDDGQSGQPDAC